MSIHIYEPPYHSGQTRHSSLTNKAVLLSGSLFSERRENKKKWNNKAFKSLKLAQVMLIRRITDGKTAEKLLGPSIL